MDTAQDQLERMRVLLRSAEDRLDMAFALSDDDRIARKFVALRDAIHEELTRVMELSRAIEISDALLLAYRIQAGTHKGSLPDMLGVTVPEAILATSIVLWRSENGTIPARVVVAGPYIPELLAWSKATFQLNRAVDSYAASQRAAS